MIDTGRAFMPLSLIMATLDAMSYTKLNVLHWHVSDDQSFPMSSTAWPNLTAGAFQAPSASHTYSRSDVLAVISAAAERGIRVLPEFDVPGHSTSWFSGYPDLATACDCPDCGATFSKPMDPTRESTYDFLAAFFADMTNVFPDAYFHIGGDEVDPTCWLNNANVTAFMAAHGFSTVTQLQGYFEARVIAMLPKKRAIMWEENEGAASVYPQNVIVQVWKEKGGNLSTLEALIRANFTAIYTTTSWYLDWTTGATDAHVNTPSLWAAYHAFDPLGNTTLTPAQQARLLGAEVAMWSPYTDAANLMSTIFPRAAAVAERLWSAPGAALDDAGGLLLRMRALRCRMLARGIAAPPIEMSGSCPATGEVPYTPPY
jgi:hexosaminidase